jgi:hypothetical protein
VEYHPFLEFRVKVTHRVARNHMDVEKLHFSASSLEISIFFSYGYSRWSTFFILMRNIKLPPET